MGDHVEQLGHTGAAMRRDEADRDQMALAQRLLERRMQLCGVDIAVLEVALDESRIDLDHLLDQCAVRGLDRAEIAVAVAPVEAVDDPGAAGLGQRQVQRQAAAAEFSLDLRQQRCQVDARCVDLVDDQQLVQPALGCQLHHPARHRLDAVDRVDHHRCGVDRRQRRQALTQKIGCPRGVDEVDSTTQPLGVHHSGVQGVQQAALERVEVAHRVATR